MAELKTDPAVLRALLEAASKELTVDEINRQRVSFVMGTLKPESSLTRAHVQSILRQQEGKVAAQ